MPPPNVPPTSEAQLSRTEKEKLLQKMYSLPHWIAIVRLFGYQSLPMDKARAEIKPIAEEFGKEKSAEACEVLVEIVPGKEPIARLKSHVRHMAFQILGPESKKPISTVPPDPVPAAPATAKTRGAKAKPGPEGKPVKQPRHHVLKQCETWLNTEKLAFVAIDDVKRATDRKSVV